MWSQNLTYVVYCDIDCLNRYVTSLIKTMPELLFEVILAKIKVSCIPRINGARLEIYFFDSIRMGSLFPKVLTYSDDHLFSAQSNLKTYGQKTFEKGLR